jgi:sigma-B regulation protein RsbU (phosphoserine phosphatase)
MGAWDWLEEHTPYAKEVAGLPLGLISGTDYAQTAVELDPGDLLLLYTDGITEACNERREMLGHEGLLTLVRDLPMNPLAGPAAFGHALLAKLQKFRGRAPQHDDETLVLVQRETEPSRA